ncbi:MAG TPA: signal peptidase I [Dehalococcoidia bacterium]|nr:signal peptidase I [Dehalococcoidia bacterium]
MNAARSSIVAAYPPRLSMPQIPRWLRLGTVAIFYAFAFLVVGVLLAATLPAFAGFHTVTVYGGSMGDALPAGSVAVTRTVDNSQLVVGDVIALGRHQGGLPTLHRIVAIEEVDGGRLVSTRGDANQTNDALPIRVSGEGDRLVYHIPWIGYFLHFVGSQLGLALFIGIPATVWTARGFITLQRAIRWIVKHRAPGERIASDFLRRGERGGIPILHRNVAIEEAGGETVVTTHGDANEKRERPPIRASGRGDRLGHHISWLEQALAFSRSARGLALLVGVPISVWAIHEAIAVSIAFKRRRSRQPALSRAG